MHIVKDINPGSNSSYISHMVAVNLPGSVPGVVFAVDDGVHGTELWRSDGANAGTYLLRDIEPGSEGSNPEWLIAFPLLGG